MPWPACTASTAATPSPPTSSSIRHSTPWAGGCHITDPEGHTSKRIALPVRFAFLADLENAQRASIAHGKWLVDQRLDRGKALF